MKPKTIEDFVLEIEDRMSEDDMSIKQIIYETAKATVEAVKHSSEFGDGSWGECINFNEATRRWLGEK